MNIESNKKIKIIHIHTDYKFVPRITIPFEGDLFDNQDIIIENKTSYQGPLKTNTIVFKRNEKNINRIIGRCSKADLVVMHDLCFVKSRIALALPKDIIVAWRFFGYELYSKRKDVFTSDNSREAANNEKLKIQELPKKALKKFYQFIKYGNTPEKIRNDAINRINYMFVLSKEEYDILKIYWNDLPRFIKLPHSYFSNDLVLNDLSIKNKGKRKIVIGNNRSSFNNHLDIIHLIKKYPQKNNFEFILLFNYGPENAYAQEVRNSINNAPSFSLINDFILSDEFKQFYQGISALLINGYRQMAGANIFSALRNGVKVYLNKKNVFLEWMKNEGFKVFTIEDFEMDFVNNNLYLDSEIAEYNLNQLKIFSKRYTKVDFQKDLYNKISGSLDIEDT